MSPIWQGDGHQVSADYRTLICFKAKAYIRPFQGLM